jgi:hypothetical protein
MDPTFFRLGGPARRAAFGALAFAALALLPATSSGAAAQDDMVDIFEGCNYCEQPDPGDPVPFDDSVLYAMDSDNDGLSDGEERDYGSSPDNPDTDGDGVGDGTEVINHAGNPLLTDSDDDGLSDLGEFNWHTDPWNRDSDGDRLPDGDEVSRDGTDPTKWDGDNDGLGDGDEIYDFGTDPLRFDSDGDRLNDYAEIFTHNTDPWNPDTDGDRVDDGTEVALGDDPATPD